MSNKVPLDRTDLVEVLSTLNSIVASLDRLTMAHADLSAEHWHAAIVDYFLQSKALKQLARARKLLSAPFSTELGPDHMDELEREFEKDGGEFWSLNGFHKMHSGF